MALSRSKVLSLAITLSGCAASQKVAIDDKTAAALNGQTITHTARGMPTFELQTAQNGSNMLNRIVEGNNVVAKNSIPDPTVAVAMGLVEAMRDAKGAQPATSPVALAGDDAAARIAALANGTARFVIDVKTVQWRAEWSTPFAWTSGYRLVYTAGARLVDVQTKAVVAEGFCKHIPEAGANDPKSDELLANGAERLKQELGKAVADCLGQLKVDMLSLPRASPTPASLATLPQPSP
jgi:hypothetical protein